LTQLQPGSLVLAKAKHHSPVSDDLMVELGNSRLARAASSIDAGIPLSLNGLLILQTFGVPLAVVRRLKYLNPG
jgi:hypothetical protein